MKDKRKRALRRIERKCDAILAIVSGGERAQTARLIESMHRSARKLREQCERERQALESYLGL